MKYLVFSFIGILSITWTSCNKSSIIPNNPETSYIDYVYPLLDAANSRWFYFASAARPFGMVSLSPDTQLGGAWGSGYRYDTDTIKGFSHIHAWQIAGVSLLPVTFETAPRSLLTDYYSSFDHSKEKADVGYHQVFLERYQIKAELTSSCRVGFHRYMFPRQGTPSIVIKLDGVLGPTSIKDGQLEIKDAYTLEGQMTNEPTRRRPKDFVVYFTIRFDQPILDLISGEGPNRMITFSDSVENLQMKVGISYTSKEHATLNLETEIPEWNFDQVVLQSKKEWDSLLGRIHISDTDNKQVRRFYTDLWHALHGRKIISDVNGAYPNNTGTKFNIGQIPLNDQGEPKFNHYNSDSFWGAQWTLNTLWGLVYPEVYNEFIQSMLLYYQDGNLISRGPSGGNYTFVMTGAATTPFIVSAYQKNIRDYNIEQAYEGLVKNHSIDGIMSKAGYEHQTNKGGGLEHYIEKGYVPYPIPEGKFGFHQDGASLTLEYSYQDWTLAQFAKALGKENDYEKFLQRSMNYKNVYDNESSWIRPKDIDGMWRTPFDPYEYESGFNESNGAQSTWFVPHDITGLADLMGGFEKAVDKLNTQMETAEKLGFTSGTSHERGEDPSRARVPINYGNQPSIQTAFIFNHLDRPDLTQFWTAKIREKAFSGLSPHTGYNGDEDQGLMGALSVLLKLGLFQLTGGTEANPKYELTTPLFNEVTIQLENNKKLKILKRGQGIYLDKILFNGNNESIMSITHDQLVNGGLLELYTKN